MGRITVFSLPSCPHCKKAKQLLTDLGWEYTDISIGAYPEKRADMLKVANRLTVPQIFFNNQHIGGATDLEELLSSDKGAQLYATTQKEPGPTLPELQVPDYPPKEPEVAAARAEEMICVGEHCVGYNEMSLELEKGLDIRDRAHHGKTYKRVFVGSECVSWLISNYGLQSREEAVQVGQSLVETGFFSHVTNDHNLEDAFLFYRLQSHAETFTLNLRRKWTDRVDKPSVTVASCNKLLGTIKSRATSDGVVDYIAVEKDPQWPEFEDAVCEFQKVDLAGMENDERLAFAINIYNMAIVHAMAKVGIAKTDMKRYSFFDKVGYCLGGEFYSLNDIENGIMRGNKVPPYHFRKPFSKNDSRISAALPQGEFRIHFALNCGAKSCPPIKFFTGDAVHEELRIASLAFAELDENVRLDVPKKTLWLSTIFAWYASDFGGSKREIANTVASLLRDERKSTLVAWLAETEGKKLSFRIRHITYDWSTNASRSKDYSSGLGKKTTGCVVM